MRKDTSGISHVHEEVRCSNWLGTVWLYCEQQFNHMKGFAEIAPVLATIEAEHAEPQSALTKKAA